ncbi:M48 family peptidase, partial [Candidatus Bathyarchaeota archaeon]
EVAIRKDKLLLFGKFYDVEVYKSEKYAISLDDRKIRIRMPGSGKPRSREYEYLRKWIRGELLKTLTNFLREYERVMKAPIGKFYIKNQKTRWASYSQKRNIHFNIKLAALPKRIIEYIVIHELAHATQPNHNRKFWYIVEKFCPDYKKRKQELKEYSLVIQKSKIWQKMLNMYT